MSDGDNVIEFQPLPKAPEAVETAIFDGLMIARSTQDRVMRLEAGDTEWQQAVMGRFDAIDAALKRIDANVNLLMQTLRSHMVAESQSGHVRPGLGDK